VESTADLLVSGVTGLALDVVHGTRSGRDVREIIATQLDRLFTTPPPYCERGNPPVMFQV